MEEGVSCKPYVVSEKFKISRKHIYDYTIETFGYFQAEFYMQRIRQSLDTLCEFYMAYPECRYLSTKNRVYRNIILDAHLIIYRITITRIEVLDIIHSASSISKIHNIRKVRL
ncbi:MAG: type II toxin-antitoxin system RelE/ParE family toxin [Bacteroidetes bacterium]|nr:type II toxin-antitoxin system RelE/ParE family toxin [Bacteroidota bacterium]MCL2301690.1 type II toxin-antitoxin system RelE/ParE family toxin [Lentimicrobiaceae bacterium]